MPKQKKDQTNKFKNIIQANIWCKLKFAMSKQEDKLLQDSCMIYGNFYYLREGMLAERQAKHKQFVSDYKNEMAKGLNNAWQYCCTKIKEKCWKYMDNHGGLLPPLDVILKCETRQINPTSKPELEVWYWYVNDLLPAAALDPNAWCVEFQGFQLLSKAKPKKAGKGVCITTSMEAFATTVLEGCHEP
jgi:hypothetical protein